MPIPGPEIRKTDILQFNALYLELLTDIGTDVIELSGDHLPITKAVAMYETLDILQTI